MHVRKLIDSLRLIRHFDVAAQDPASSRVALNDWRAQIDKLFHEGLILCDPSSSAGFPTSGIIISPIEYAYPVPGEAFCFLRFCIASCRALQASPSPRALHLDQRTRLIRLPFRLMPSDRENIFAANYFVVGLRVCKFACAMAATLLPTVQNAEFVAELQKTITELLAEREWVLQRNEKLIAMVKKNGQLSMYFQGQLHGLRMELNDERQLRIRVEQELQAIRDRKRRRREANPDSALDVVVIEESLPFVEEPAPDVDMSQKLFGDEEGAGGVSSDSGAMQTRRTGKRASSRLRIGWTRAPAGSFSPSGRSHASGSAELTDVHGHGDNDDPPCNDHDINNIDGPEESQALVQEHQFQPVVQDSLEAGGSSFEIALEEAARQYDGGFSQIGQ